MNNMSLSVSLRDSLLELSRTVHAESAASEEKANAAAAKAIGLIDDQLPLLRGSSRDVALEFKDLISRSDWAELPTPRDLLLTFQKIDDISKAVSGIIENIATDFSEIFRLLMEITRQIMLNRNEEKARAFTIETLEAKDAAEKRLSAANSQKIADLAQAGAQIAGGIATALGSGASFLKSVQAARKSAEALQKAGGANNPNKSGLMDKISDKIFGKTEKPLPGTDLDSLQTKKNQAMEALTTAKDKLSDAKLQRADGKKVNELREQFSAAKAAFDEADLGLKKMERDVDSLSRDAARITADSNAWQMLANSMSQMSNGLGGIVAANEKYLVAKYQYEAETIGIAKETASKGYQSGGDATQSAKQSLRDLISAIQAFEQILSNMHSVLAKNVV